MELPKRKRIRLEGYDYSAQGAYFVTVCSEGRRPIFWDHVGADIIRPDERLPLSEYGRIIDKAIQAISIHYPNVQVDKYCIMPNHIDYL